MKVQVPTIPFSTVAASLLAISASGVALAQQTGPASEEKVQEVIVTGSRIAQTEAQREQPLSVIGTEAIEKTGLAGIGDLLSQLTTGGSALNAKFNSSGNFGYPPDGGGIGAGSAQVDLRNLESKRTLVLVDGIRWVNESSASGLSGSADLNTIPLSIVDRIEVLEDGASSIYGSDAIAGVVNVITKKKMDGVEVNGYVGQYGKGGRTTEGSVTAGGSSDKFSGMFVASYYNQDAISSADWWQSAVPEPYAGLAAGSSGVPQGRFQFCNPANGVPKSPGFCTGDQATYYNLSLNQGTTSPLFDPANPTVAPSTYHQFGTADRFNFAPFNLLLTPSERRSIFTNLTYTINDNIEAYAKGLFNNRQSTNQAAPEPIFVGPNTGSGGLADHISISALNPFNPFGIDLNANGPNANLGWVTRRPLEGGPRIFTQDVDTWYFSGGLRGNFQFLDSSYHWDVNFADSANKASQKFVGGYNLGNIQLALGDPAICAQVQNCTPLDLFGGQGRPITAAQLKYIEATQIDASEQDLRVVSANISGHPFSIQDRPVGIAVGAEHRNYTGIFSPDPLRQEGLSQDSPAFPVNQAYRVNEAYAEFSVPVLPTLGASGAVRYSDYSNFGSTTTYKGGLRWQPIDDFGFRGTYSTGFRAPNLGELYGLTSFGATLVDPCGPTGGTGLSAALQAACLKQGAPVGFQQANTQITTFTGGNPNLKPEKSESYTMGFVYNASWAQDLLFTQKLTLEATYYHHLIKGAIAPEDIQQLLNTCLAAGGTSPTLCAPFSRQASGNLNPPQNFLQNLADITTDGEDLKFNWLSQPTSIGHFSTSVITTRVNKYRQVDALGIVSQKQVGIEQANSAIPQYRMNAQIGYGFASFEFTWTVRYLSAVKESCANVSVTPVPGCADGNATTFNTLRAMTYNDAQVQYRDAFKLTGLTVEAGVNNLFGANPPVCLSCTLNGYDAGTYDLPGAFWNVRAKYKF
jgi:iron complex outermembrane recepter protein